MGKELSEPCNILQVLLPWKHKLIGRLTKTKMSPFFYSTRDICVWPDQLVTVTPVVTDVGACSQALLHPAMNRCASESTGWHNSENNRWINLSTLRLSVQTDVRAAASWNAWDLVYFWNNTHFTCHCIIPSVHIGHRLLSYNDIIQCSFQGHYTPQSKVTHYLMNEWLHTYNNINHSISFCIITLKLKPDSLQRIQMISTSITEVAVVLCLYENKDFACPRPFCQWWCSHRQWDCSLLFQGHGANEMDVVWYRGFLC